MGQWLSNCAKKVIYLDLFSILVRFRLPEDPCALGLCTGRNQDWEEDLIGNTGLAKDQDWD